MIPLKEELDLVQLYISIEKIRFGDKMKFEKRIEPDLLAKPFPAMLLQPLLENAVKHGIANSRSGGLIELSIKKSGTNILGIVSNKIDGHKEEATGNGISLKNIQQRLDRMYGENYRWQVEQSDGEFFRVTFQIPIGI